MHNLHHLQHLQYCFAYYDVMGRFIISYHHCMSSRFRPCCSLTTSLSKERIVRFMWWEWAHNNSACTESSNSYMGNTGGLICSTNSLPHAPLALKSKIPPTLPAGEPLPLPMHQNPLTADLWLYHRSSYIIEHYSSHGYCWWFLQIMMPDSLTSRTTLE